MRKEKEKRKREKKKKKTKRVHADLRRKKTQNSQMKKEFAEKKNDKGSGEGNSWEKRKKLTTNEHKSKITNELGE